MLNRGGVSSTRRRGPAALLIALGLLGAAACDEPCPEDFEPIVLPEFMLGFSQVPGSAVQIASEIGVKYIRPTLSWRVIEPEVEVLGLTVDQVRNDPQMVADYITDHNWTSFENRLGAIVAADQVPFPIIGHGYTGTLARLNGEPADPDTLGREDYLAHMYLFTRATVERFDGDGFLDAPSGLRVSYWQTENELNQALLTAVWGWRSPGLADALQSAWADWDFVTEILRTLRLAVKDADATALTTMNFHTDIHENINRSLGHPGWLEAVQQWRLEMDIVSMDAYPNYYEPAPVRGGLVGERVAQIRQQSCGMPVVVMETGYPSGPAVEGFDEASQALYIEQAYSSSVAAGASGFFLFGTQTSEQHTVEITETDVQNLQLVAAAYGEGDLLSLARFLLQNYEYIEDHFIDVLQAVEPYWGLVRADGEHKASWAVMEDIAQNLPGPASGVGCPACAAP